MIIICMLFAFVTTAQPFVMMQIVIWELCKDSLRIMAGRFCTAPKWSCD